MPSKDREERVEALKKLEDKLSDRSRGDVYVMSDCIVELGRAVCLMLITDFVKPEELDALVKKSRRKFGWPGAAVAVTTIIAVSGFVIKLMP